MVDQIEIQTVGPLKASIRPPGSKSITNRALVCAALAEGESVLRGALESDDTQVMIEGLCQLGIGIDADFSTDRVRVPGCGGKLPADHAELYVGNSGTTVRFLTALATVGHGTFRLSGVERMRQRPIADLVDALNDLGGAVRTELAAGCPPVLVTASGLAGGRTTIRGDVSSQFLSGLLLVAPYAERDVEIIVQGPLVSKPYVQMTLGVMSAFGVEATSQDQRRYLVSSKARYQAREYGIEPDASAASYFWAAAAIAGGSVTVQGLTKDALQGDVAFCDCLARMGCSVDYGCDHVTVTQGPLHGIEVDMNAISDTVQTLAAVALFAEGPTTITGVGHIRHKETDRIGDLARELRKLGATVEEHDDGLKIVPGTIKPATIATYEDHRMAMSLALVGLRRPGIVIRDPACTRKTYPGFFRDLRSLRKQQLPC